MGLIAIIVGVGSSLRTQASHVLREVEHHVFVFLLCLKDVRTWKMKMKSFEAGHLNSTAGEEGEGKVSLFDKGAKGATVQGASEKHVH